MRLVAFFVATALIVPGAAEAAQWTLLKFPADGFGIESPVPLTKGSGVYKAGIAKTVPTTVYSGSADSVRYQVTIIDISKRRPEAVNLFEEAEYLDELSGKVLANESLGVEPGVNRNYGREIAVQRKDGSFAITSVMYHDGKIYEAEASVPANGDQSSPDPQRFVDSIIFALTGQLRDDDANR